MSKFNLIDEVTNEIISVLQSDYDYYTNIFNDYEFNKSDYNDNRLLTNVIIPHFKELLKKGMDNNNIVKTNYSIVLSLFDYLQDDSNNQSWLYNHLMDKIKNDILIKKSINQNGDDTPLYTYQY